MMRRLTVAAFILIAATAHATQITTTIGVASEPKELFVRALRLDAKAEAIELRVRVPGVNTLTLPEGVWELRVASEGYWAPRVYARDGDSVTLPLWPAVPLRGTAKGVTKLGVAFTSLDARGPVGETECSIEADAWTCAIPPGQYDLRFAARGSAPEFRWNVTAPGKLDAPLQFVAGASLSGRLEAVRGAKISLTGIEISLNGAQRYKAKADRKGFFQFKGLPPGQYSLRARREGLAAQARSVIIVAGAAAELNAPLFLDRPKRLTVMLTPALDPELKPWRVSLWARSVPQRGLTVVTESTAMPSGEWSASGLVAGEYELEIARPDGGMWKSVDVPIGDTDVTLPVSVTGEHITGIITLGQRPLAAKLSFGGEHGATLTSDEGGRFEGEIPPASGNERTIYVEAEAARIARTVRANVERSESGARITIKLPATLLTGHVLGEDGSPKNDALITVSGNGPGTFRQLFVENDGSFQLAGVDAGEYTLTAHIFSGERSERVVVSLRDDEPSEVELVLKSAVVLRGRVGIGETPLVEAYVYGLPRDTPITPPLPVAKTNQTGRFELQLPPRTSIFDLVVVHPAFDTVLTRIAGQVDAVRQVIATQLGGTLTVDTRDPRDVLLRHAGAECWLLWLAKTPGTNGMVESSRVIVPRLEPGEYTVCSAKTNRCGHGTLPPFGTLNLRLDG